jgi:prephenate dehydratase
MEPRVQNIVLELKRTALMVKMLGCYPRAD